MKFFEKFKKNRRGLYSLIFLAALFTMSLFAEFIANDKPIFLRHNGQVFFPIFQNITELQIGGIFQTQADFRDVEVQKLIAKSFTIWPPIRFSYDSINYQMNAPAPSFPSATNFLGTDDQGRDVLARLIYGVRISLFFGLILSTLTLIIAVLIGAAQGYFGKKVDIFAQRFIEIWSAMPVLFLLIILSSIITPNFFSLLFLMLLFSWVSLSSMVRAEFLRLKNFDFVLASKALGANNSRIMFRHILPNAAPIILATLPFLLSGSIATLASLDFLGFGMPAGSPSLGELLAQGKNNLNAYHLGIVGFVAMSSILIALIFIGEAFRDAMDSRI
jgi:microcin C transport system permease protein